MADWPPGCGRRSMRAIKGFHFCVTVQRHSAHCRPTNGIAREVIDMATERIPHAGDPDAITPEEQAGIERALADSAAGRVYRLGSEDLEGFINLPEEQQAIFRESRASLDAWLAARAAKYA